MIFAKCLKSRSKLHKYFQSLIFRQSFLLLNIIPKSPPITKLINKIIIIISPQHLHKSNNIWMIYLCQYTYLIICKFTQFWCMLKFIHTHHLYSKYLFILSMLSTIYITILTFTYTLHQYIILYHFVHYTFFKIFFLVILKIIINM